MTQRASLVAVVTLLALVGLANGGALGTGLQASPVLVEGSPEAVTSFNRIAFANRDYRSAVGIEALSFAVSVHRDETSAQENLDRFIIPIKEGETDPVLVTISFPVFRDGTNAIYSSLGEPPVRVEVVDVAVRDGRFVFFVSVVGEDVLDTVLPLMDLLPPDPEAVMNDRDPASALELLPSLEDLPIGYYLDEERLLSGLELPENIPTPTVTPVPTMTATPTPRPPTATATPSPTADLPATVMALAATATAGVRDIATSEAAAADAKATVASLEEDQAAAEATATVLAEAAANSALDPDRIDLTIDVSLSGILNGDRDAREDAVNELRQVLEPYTECRVGFVLIGGYADSIGQGNDFAEAIVDILRSEYPDIFEETAYETFANIAEPTGRVEMSLFLYQGCDRDL